MSLINPRNNTDPNIREKDRYPNPYVPYINTSLIGGGSAIYGDNGEVTGFQPTPAEGLAAGQQKVEGFRAQETDAARARNIDTSAADAAQQRQIDAAGRLNLTARDLGTTAASLRDYAGQSAGPSVAEAQQRLALNRAAADASGALGSGAGQRAAIRATGAAGEDIGARYGGQRAQEANDWRSGQIAALQGAGNVYGAQGSAYGAAGGIYTDARGQLQDSTGAALKMQGLNDRLALGLEDAGQAREGLAYQYLTGDAKQRAAAEALAVDIDQQERARWASEHDKRRAANAADNSAMLQTAVTLAALGAGV